MRGFYLLAGLLVCGGLLTQRSRSWAEEGVSAPAAQGREDEAAPSAVAGQLSPYEQLLRERGPLLLQLDRLQARRYLFEVASDPEKGPALEQEIQAAFQRVVDLYERYLVTHPDDARAHYDLGELYYSEVPDEDRAEVLWLRTIELDPNFDLAYNSLAVHYADTARHEKALRYVQRALELNPEVAAYHFNAATFYFGFRKTAVRLFGWDLKRVWQELTAQYEWALRLDPTNYMIVRDYAQAFYFATFFGVEPDYQRARALWQQALPLAPHQGERIMVLNNLARVALLVGDREAARDYLEQAFRLAPKNPVSRLLQHKLEVEESPNH